MNAGRQKIEEKLNKSNDAGRQLFLISSIKKNKREISFFYARERKSDRRRLIWITMQWRSSTNSLRTMTPLFYVARSTENKEETTAKKQEVRAPVTSISFFSAIADDINATMDNSYYTRSLCPSFH